MQVTRHNSCWVSPFGHPRINARLPTPQGISQAPTSFIGSRCQGIHHAPLTTCPQQTTNTHNKHPHPARPHKPAEPKQRASACTRGFLMEQDHQRTHKTIKRNNTQDKHPEPPHNPTNPHTLTGTRDRMSCTACAECSYSRPLSKNQTTRSQPALPPHPGGMASDASDTQQRAIQAPPTPTPTNRRQTRARKHVVFH